MADTVILKQKSLLTVLKKPYTADAIAMCLSIFIRSQYRGIMALARG